MWRSLIRIRGPAQAIAIFLIAPLFTGVGHIDLGEFESKTAPAGASIAILPLRPLRPMKQIVTEPNPLQQRKSNTSE